MSDSLKPNDSELTKNSDQSAAALTEALSTEPKLEVYISPFAKLTTVDLDSESSGDELTAFDRERVLSDTDESDTEKKVQGTQAPSESPTDPPASDPVSGPVTPEPKETVTSPENREDETPAESETKEDVDNPQLPSVSVTPPVSEQTVSIQ